MYENIYLLKRGCNFISNVLKISYKLFSNAIMKLKCEVQRFSMNYNKTKHGKQRGWEPKVTKTK